MQILKIFLFIFSVIFNIFKTHLPTFGTSKFATKSYCFLGCLSLIQLRNRWSNEWVSSSKSIDNFRRRKSWAEKLKLSEIRVLFFYFFFLKNHLEYIPLLSLAKAPFSPQGQIKIASLRIFSRNASTIWRGVSCPILWLNSLLTKTTSAM